MVLAFRILAFLLFLAGSAHGQEVSSSRQKSLCNQDRLIVPLGKTKASAGLFSNLFNREGSMSYESEKAFRVAQTQISQAKKPHALCRKPCEVSDAPSISLRSTPSAFKSQYSDYDYCQRKTEETSQSPLRFQQNGFRTLEELSSWIERFSQGKGKEGKELYEACDASCSPRYHYRIMEVDDLYSVHAEIVCGHARDKSENSYMLEYSYEWSCQ